MQALLRGRACRRSRRPMMPNSSGSEPSRSIPNSKEAKKLAAGLWRAGMVWDYITSDWSQRSRFYWKQRTEVSLKQVIEDFQRSITLGPDYAVHIASDRLGLWSLMLSQPKTPPLRSLDPCRFLRTSKRQKTPHGTPQKGN